MYDSTSICQCGCEKIIKSKAKRRFYSGHGPAYFRMLDEKRAIKIEHFWKQCGKALSLYKKDECCLCSSNVLLRIHNIESIDIMTPDNWVTVCAKCRGMYKFKMYLKKRRDNNE